MSRVHRHSSSHSSKSYEQSQLLTDATHTKINSVKYHLPTQKWQVHISSYEKMTRGHKSLKSIKYIFFPDKKCFLPILVEAK